MNAQCPRQTIRAATLWAAAILLTSCVTPEPYVYAPPLEGEPAAWIKLQYVYYTGVRGGHVTMRVRMFIREGQEERFRPAHNQSLGPLTATENPKVPMHAARIRPAEDTAISMRLGLEWKTRDLFPWTPTFDSKGRLQTSTQQQINTHQAAAMAINESDETGCSATQQFNPEPDKVYLASYTFLPRLCGPDCWLSPRCQVVIFLETPTGDGTFKLEPVGEPYVE